MHPGREKMNDNPIIFKRCSWKMGILHDQSWLLTTYIQVLGAHPPSSCLRPRPRPWSPASCRTCANKSGSPHSSAKRKRCSTSRFFSSMGSTCTGNLQRRSPTRWAPKRSLYINGVSYNLYLMAENKWVSLEL